MAGILLCMLCSVSAAHAQQRIRIGEGTLEDWDGVLTRIADAVNDVNGNHNDVHMLWVTHDSEFLYVRFDGDFSKNHNMAIHLDLEDSESGTIVAKAWIIKHHSNITLEIAQGGMNNQAVSGGLVEYFVRGSGREFDTVHAAWPLEQLGLAGDSTIVLRAESHASHSTNSAVKDRVPDAPLKLAYDLSEGAWRPHQPGAVFGLEFITEPSDVVYNQPMTPEVVVGVTDGSGQRLPIGGVPIEIALADGTGKLFGTSHGWTNESGQAVFNDLRFDTHGEKRLKAIAVGMEEAVSRPFTVLAPDLFVNELVVYSESGYPTDAAARGETIVYALNITNVGTWPVEPTVMSPVPVGTIYVVGSTWVTTDNGEFPVDDVWPGESPLAQGVTLPEIAPGERVRVSYQVVVDSGNAIGFEILGTAVVSDGLRTIELQAVTTVLAPEISVFTATDATSIAPGDQVTFQITIVNTSAVAAHHVQIVSPVPSGMSYMARSVNAPDGTAIRFLNAKTGDWQTTEPDDVAAVEWVLGVVKATSTETVSLQLQMRENL